jgi:type IV fimbrial biogenesis protein FimT
MRKDAGLTLVELLVAMAVLGILLGIGVPALGQFATESRLTATTNRLVSALHLARSEAVRRNTRVTLCASADGVFCAAEGDWDQGWIVFVDGSGTGARAVEDPILAVGESAAPGVAVTGNQPVQRYVSYVGLGATRRANGSLQMGTLTVCAGAEGRRVIISRTGRPRQEHGGCSA